MKIQELKINGMTCGHCAAAVRQSLTSIPGVVVDEVSIGKAVVRYDETRVDPKTLTQAVENAGYAVSQ